MAYRSEEDRQRRVEYAREVREYRKSLGMCERCGKERVAVNSKRLCLDCLEVNRQKQESRWKGKSAEERRQIRDKYNASRREKQDQRRRDGLCVVCGKPVYNGHSNCMEHYLYYRRKKDEYRDQKKKGYKELGLCINCGKECVPGKKY